MDKPRSKHSPPTSTPDRPIVTPAGQVEPERPEPRSSPKIGVYDPGTRTEPSRSRTGMGAIILAIVVAIAIIVALMMF
jgi:hypothetical protein